MVSTLKDFLVRNKYIFLLLAASGIWGIGFIFVEIALEEGIQPFFITTVRFAISGLILLVYNKKRIKTLSKSTFQHGIILGIFLFLGFVFQTIGQNYTSVPRNAFLTAIYVVIVPFLAWIVYRKRPGIFQFIAAILTLIGVRILNLDVSGENSLGDFLVILCAVFFAIHITLLGIYTKNHDPLLLTAVQSLIAAVISALFMFLVEHNASFSIKGILAVVYLGIFSSCIAFSFQSIAQKHLSQVSSSIILSTEAVFGTLFSIMFLGERLNKYFIISAVIMLGAILLAEVQINKQRKIIKEVPPSPLLDQQDVNAINTETKETKKTEEKS